SPASLLFPPVPESATTEGGDGLNLRETLRRTERRLLERALTEAAGSKRQAARLLGIDERNLGYFLRKHGLK
ncbi:MAG TPA: helix-turn-helix domain-containing protein, partial [Thermoanaerobaculia bacterium]|nr:helix-turn-helix domain-containing protein [Thermoanaerobaculia bacterium]